MSNKTKQEMESNLKKVRNHSATDSERLKTYDNLVDLYLNDFLKEYRKPPLDGEVEEAIEHRMNCIDGEIDDKIEKLSYFPLPLPTTKELNDRLNYLKEEYKFFKKIRQHITNQQTALKDYNVLDEEVTRQEEVIKHIQSKLNKIREELNRITKLPIGKTGHIIIHKIQQILGDDENE